MSHPKALVYQVPTARWAWRFSFFSVMLLLAVILSRRIPIIDDAALIAVLAIVVLGAIVGFFLVCLSAANIWNKGYGGMSLTIYAMLLSFVVLIPTSYGIYLIVRLPVLNDVSTDLVALPSLSINAEQMDRRVKPRVTAGPLTQEMQIEAYPDIRSHIFKIGLTELALHVEKIAADLRWNIESVGGSDENDAEIIIHAVATSRILKFRDDVGMRLQIEGEDVRVDIRSRSRFGRHDLGANAARIRNFFNALEGLVVDLHGASAIQKREAEDG